jgi:hypothetical protein
MGEDVLLLDFNLTSSLLLIAVEGIGAVWANNGVLILLINIL